MTASPASPSSSAAPPLVSTQWLADHLGAPDLVVLDASVAAFTQPNGTPGYLSGHEEYIVHGHLPGAVFADVIDELSDPEGTTPFTRPDAARLAEVAHRLGVGRATRVVVYDGAVGQWASRVWWLLRAAGHEQVSVLDGGLTRWRDEGRPLQTGHVEPAAVPEDERFRPVEQPGYWADKAEVERAVAGDADAVLVCASPAAEFAGGPTSRARPGHIPGSVSVPAATLVDRERRTVRPPSELREVLRAPITAARSGSRVIVYCGAGIAATAAALDLRLLGVHDVAVYDGSLTEWAADPAAPLVTAN